jgi:hypothetical protein
VGPEEKHFGDKGCIILKARLIFEFFVDLKLNIGGLLLFLHASKI